jgi:hypothetical protein
MATFAQGCCSAIFPCSHQQKDPFSICDICQQSHDMARDRALSDARRLLESHGYTVTKPQKQTVTA